MTTELYFQHIKTGKKYKVIKLVKLDKASSEITLQGEYMPFTDIYSKERFEQLGYKLIKVEKVDA